MNLNEFLATEVMGWTLVYGDEPYPFDTHPFYTSNGEDLVIFKKNWNPTENIEQAIMCAEALPHRWVVEALRDPLEKPYLASIREADRLHNLAIAAGDSPEEALSLAVARARGFEG